MVPFRIVSIFYDFVKIFALHRMMHAGSLSEGVAGDICVCAPTGSGKTLAYAIPIVNVCDPPLAIASVLFDFIDLCVL